MTIGVVGVAASALLLLTGCGDDEEIVAEADVLEEGVVGAADTDETLGSAQSADCPDDLVLEDGASIDCTVTMTDGTEQTATITAIELGSEDYDFEIEFS